jgi:hypothetical protein
MAITLAIISPLITQTRRTAVPATLLGRVLKQALLDHKHNIARRTLAIRRSQHTQMSHMTPHGRQAATLQRNIRPEKHQGTVAASPTVLGPAM